MESIILFYDNALIYSPNLFFVSLALLLIFIALLISNVFYLFMESVRYTTEYINQIQKKRKNPKHNITRFSLKIKLLLKIIFITFFILNKKRAKIISSVRKILNAIKEEVLIKEGEQT